MKRLCLLVILFSMVSLSASAQWYLFPGRKKNNNPPAQDTVRLTPRPDSATFRLAQDSTATALADSLSARDSLDRSDLFVLDIPSVIRIALILPLQASAENRASDNFLDLYSGALLALRDLGAAGLRAELEVFDSGDGKTPVPQSLLDGSDVIIGPVSLKDIQATLPRLGSGKVLISPLEPKVAELASTAPIVQNPSPWTAQIDELVRWVQLDRLSGEDLYVIRDSTSTQAGTQAAYLIGALHERGIPFRSVTTAGDIPFEKDRQVRVMIASDIDNFITGAVRNLSIQGARNNNVTLYGTTRVRTNGTSQTDLHNLNAHLTSTYYIDYADPEVERFILAYRALFQNEPGSFAFQGYDVMHYYVSICKLYGRQWYKKLQAFSENGLQSDFRFTDENGRINQAVRRVIYKPDLTTSRQ